MSKARLATFSASIGAGLVFLTAGFHFSAYGTVVEQAHGELKPLIAAVWVFSGVALILAALLAIAVTPLFIVRRRALLCIAALTPLSIALVQIVYLGFLPPTALLLVDTLVLVMAGQLGVALQPRPYQSSGSGVGTIQ
jgi:hypothetical protein